MKIAIHKVVKEVLGRQHESFNGFVGLVDCIFRCWLNGRLFRSAGTVIFANGIGASFWVLFERLVGRALSLRCRSKATPHGDLSADRSIFFVVCL